DVQEYPDLREYPEGPPEQPYDAAGWTLPFLMDVNVVEVRSPLSADARSALKPVRGKPTDWRASAHAPFSTDSVAAGIVAPAVTVGGSGDRIALDPANTDAFKVIGQAIAAGGSVRFVPGTGGQSGRYVVSGVATARVEGWVRDQSVRAERTSLGAASGTARKRIAIFKPWTASMDEGWTEWLLDQYGFKYAVIAPADVRAGDLASKYDVILMASESPRAIMDGFGSGTVPPRYAGGIGDLGAREIDAFVRAGGTLVCLNQSASFAIDQLGLPVKNVVAGVQRKDFFASGSILEVTTNPAQQVMAGMPERAKVFVDGSPVFKTLEGFEGATLATYAPAGSPRLSGYLLGEKLLNGNAAALDVKHGRGRVVLIGFRPQWRGQPFGTFRVVFNSLL
ncbi:MAG TPA: hypothetical protein VM076_24920, partial [Gemmatimonadaceae bacterium]|nr:hypothetical protein [Gemmatimonadaceae bacterium]